MTHNLETYMEKLLALRRRTAARSVTKCMRVVSAKKREERIRRECEAEMKRRQAEKEKKERIEREARVKANRDFDNVDSDKTNLIVN